MSEHKKKPQKIVLKTVLLVGEGPCEKAFLEYLKSVYIVRGCGLSMSVLTAYGKGPQHVVDKVIGLSRNAAYSLKAALLDTDIPWTPKLRKKARNHRIHLIGSPPCLEGLLLTILCENAPHRSDDCKKKFQPMLSGKPTDQKSYAGLFTKAILEERRHAVSELNRLLTIFEGENPDF